ncbi:MAG: Plug domain-containing protein, partial [Methylococcaceae bacterium]|nr:Plug domain-containing protein [Methylococcaceae bacterium]
MDRELCPGSGRPLSLIRPSGPASPGGGMQQGAAFSCGFPGRDDSRHASTSAAFHSASLVPQRRRGGRILPVLAVLATELGSQVVCADEASPTTELETVTISATRPTTQASPLEGLVIDKDQIPGNVQTVSAADIKKSQATSLTDLMYTQLQSVNINDYQGNPFQMDVSYRGFSASPQLGTPQGLSVFIDGVRVNEPFGDVVNWDLIPLNAISSLNVMPGSNPLFGQNTLDGALSLRTRNGNADTG